MLIWVAALALCCGSFFFFLSLIYIYIYVVGCANLTNAQCVSLVKSDHHSSQHQQCIFIHCRSLSQHKHPHLSIHPSIHKAHREPLFFRRFASRPYFLPWCWIHTRCDESPSSPTPPIWTYIIYINLCKQGGKYTESGQKRDEASITRLLGHSSKQHVQQGNMHGLRL